MKKFTPILLSLAFTLCASAETYKDKTWGDLCGGKMSTEWYGSAEAKSVADTLLGVQKTNGGWMKNYQYHTLTAAELSEYKSASSRAEHSCFDNYSTTQEMRFLAKVYKQTKEERYLTALKKALNLIFESGQGLKGGWAQYWPLSDDKYSYQNYITFNDDLMTNMMKLLMEITQNKGDFADLFDDETKAKCQTQFDNALQCVMNCQVDDNGTKSAWCAQHDPSDFLPTEGRPHELPSISGYESAALLSFLMTIPNPSQELQQSITSAIEWFKKHIYKENAAIEDYTNAQGEADRHIVDKQGSNVWGRFIQIGGESGEKIYQKFYNKLKERNKSRVHHESPYHSYKEYELAEASYDKTKAYQPIYAIYSNDYPELFYRYLYNYDDTEDITDKYGQKIKTSLMAGNRRSYQYLGSWLDGTFKTYEAWKAKMDQENEKGDDQLYILSQETYDKSTSTTVWAFDNGFTVTNQKDKGYSTGSNNTVKYSSGVDFTITIPEALAVKKVTFYGYDNYDADSYLSKLNGTAYSATDYVFPAKVDGVANNVTHTIDLSSNPAKGSLPFTIGKKQTCLIISLYCTDASTGINSVTVDADTQTGAVKYFCNNKLTILKNGKCYNALGQQMPVE